MPFEITIVNTAERFTCAPDQTLLSAMERLGRKGIPVGCRNGGCGVCKVRVREGSYRTGRMSRAVLSAAEQAERCTLACKTYPQGEMAVEVTGAMVRAVCAPRPAAAPGFDFDFKRPLSQPHQET
ncbi:2Fe-2S iron-sulfur cluster-binding protein [Pseudorhodoferax sp.]|uniref:2Fe-2S iron-sulfur cluster-binding protein n=1 Tax=Pseudorhodoferax sp. TaxID=1993553 RepID=UPI002DD66692|nr:2Fe-2S iron-sulfur cluster-binding protein [Pseudorhodoferax sp.]